MKIILVLLILFSANLFAERLLANKYTNNILKIKVQFTNKMTTHIGVERGIYKELDYMTSAEIKADNKVIMRIKTSYYVSKNPFFKFINKNIDAKVITAQQIDNKNRIKSISKKIKFKDKKYEYLAKKSMKPLRVSKRFALESFDETSVKKMFNSSKMINANIYISMPEIAANGGEVPVHIVPDVDVKSVTIFATNNKNKMEFICQWVPTKGYEPISYDLKIKMHTGYVRVVVESKSGKLYTVTRYTDIPIGGGAS